MKENISPALAFKGLVLMVGNMVASTGTRQIERQWPWPEPLEPKANPLVTYFL